MNCFKRMIVMRGLPGSGKSTRAREIVKRLADLGLRTSVRSTDDQFMVNGEYRFDPKRIVEAHAVNQKLAAGDMAEGVNVVVIDNTNIQKWEFANYLTFADAHGYEVRYETVGEFTEEAARACAARNTHGVPVDAVIKMAARFEA